MKQRKKVLSAVMAILLTFGTILSPLSMCVEAQDVTDTSSSEYRLILDIQQMGQGRDTFPFGYKNYNCETNDTQIIASKDYTNVITYCADSDGYLRVDDLSIELKGTSTEREVEFAVVDDAGVILTNHGQVVTVNSEDAKKVGLGVEAYEVKQGENLHFVFHGVVASGNSMRAATKIMFSSDGETWVQKNSTGKLWASTNSNTSGTQGEEGFYYNYSTTYVKEEIAEDSVGIVYKEMEGSRSGFPFMYVNSHCMTNRPQIIASKGYTNVVAYQMPFDGQIKLEALKIWIANTDLSTTERAFEFAVIDSTGKVLSNDGKIAVVNSANSTVSGMSVDALELKAGERIYFVLHGTAGTVNSLRCSAKIMTSADGNEWSQMSQDYFGGDPLLWAAGVTNDTAEQGKDNFYYGYSATYVTHDYTKPSTQEPENPQEQELVDFVVEVEDGREPVILQLSDTQIIDPTQDRRSTPLSETAKNYWAPEKINERLYDSLTETIEATKPDLILLTGDLVYGEFDDNGTMFESLIAKMESFGIPWAPIFGNHENESAKGVDWQCQQLENAEHCLFKQRTLTGNGNYTVGIKQDGQLKRVFFMMDSNGCGAMHENSKENGHYKKSSGFGQDQMDWSIDIAEKIKETSPDTKISFAFHIQIAAFADAYAKYGFTNGGTEENPINIDKLENKAVGDFGYIGCDLKNPWDSDHAFFNQMKAVEVDSIFVGHEHCNSASVVYEGIRFQFGQKTGTYDRANFVKDDGTVYGASCSSDTPLSGGTVMVMASDGSFKNAYIYLTGDAQAKLDGTYNDPTIPGAATIPEANEDGNMPTYKINFEAADMVASDVHASFPLSMPGKEYDCMTNPIGNQIVSKGYANIIKYKVQEVGTLTLKSMTAAITPSKAQDDVVLFAITDKEGNILYPADGTLAVLDKDKKEITGTFLTDYEVEIGDEINFIFEGVEGKTTSCRVRGVMVQYDSQGKETRLTREAGGYIAPLSGSTAQGADGFHYQYARSFENVQTGYVTPPAPEVIPGTATVPTANEEGLLPTYKIKFEAENMVASTVHKSFPWSMPDKEYYCMTNPIGNQIVSKGYANILTYTVQQTGTLTLKSMTAAITPSKSQDDVVLFAITDKEGNILYPADGTLAVLNKDNTAITGTFLKDYKVKKGDEINFIFEGVEGKTTSCRVRGVMVNYDSKGNETRLTREAGGYIAPVGENTDQGAEGFYYRYAKTFENVQTGYAVPPAPEVLPGNATVPVANAQGLVPQYKINFEAADMVASTIHKSFPLSMPDKEYDCMTNPIGNQIVSKGYANIITYTAQKAGKLTLKNMTAAISVTNAPENVVLFAVTDKDGNVLYPNDGTLAVLNKDNESVTGTFLSQFEVKKGDEINFIFQGVEGKTVSCRIRGIIVYFDSEGKETRLTREAGGYIAPFSGNTAQGAEGFSYRYAKKFENVVIGYVEPKSKAVQWGEGIQVVVSNNPDDFVYTEATTDNAATENKVDMIEIIKPDVELRYKYIPWIIVAVSGVLFGSQWVVFLIENRKGGKQNEENI